MNEYKQEVLNVVGGIVALGIVGILGFITWALIFRPIPHGNENTLIQLVGVLSANVAMIVGFFYGSSVGSKRQSETIDKLADTARSVQQANAPKEPAIQLQDGESVKVEASGDTSGAPE